MSDDKRSNFLAKVVVAGGGAVAGLACIYGGLSSIQEESGFAAVALPVLGVGLGVLFLRTAWKIAGE